MKFSRIVKISFCLLLFVLFGCSNYEEIPYDNKELIVDFNETKSEDLKLKKEFTISFWLKPEANYYGSTVLTLNDDKQTLTLLCNTMDENYYSTGLYLYHDNGAIYKDGNSRLDTYTYNQVVIRFKNNTFYLSLNGEEVGNGMFSKNLDTKNLSISFGGNLFKGEFKDIQIVNKYLDDEVILSNYNENLLYRLDNVDYDETFKQDASGKVRCPNSKYDIVYTSESNLINIEDNYLIFSNNDSEKDVTANIIASTTINDIKVEKTISFNIKGNNLDNKIDEVVNKVSNNLNYIISESNTFDTKVDDYLITYEVIDGEASFDNDTKHFIKNSENEKENIKVKATITLDNLSREITKEITLIDEYYGYLLVYFTGYDGYPDYLAGRETIYFATSTDKVNWTKLTDKKTISTSEGSGRFRDPYIQRTKDNKFVIVTTEAYSNTGMYVIDTDDFENFDVNLVSFTSNDAVLGLDGNEVWAPEFFYNEDKDMYTITYSDPSENCGGIFAVDTKDFKNFSYPYLFFNASDNVIDCDVAVINGKYFMFYKNENDYTLHYASTNNISSNVWNIENDEALVSKYSLEGPELFTDHKTEDITLYVDAYEAQVIMSGKVFENNDKLTIDLSKDLNIGSLNEVRHFSIIELTQKEYERIVENYEK